MPLAKTNSVPSAWQAAVLKPIGTALSLLLAVLLVSCGGGGSTTSSNAGTADTSTPTSPSTPLSTTDARALAKQAYIVAYPAVSNYAKQSPRAFDTTSLTYTGTDKLYSFPLLFNNITAQQANIPSPNNDTLYSSGVLDLRTEPAVLTAGAVSEANRYYSLQLLDMDTNVLPYISSLTNLNKGGTYLVVGPLNQMPADTSAFTGVIHSQSSLVTVLGRVQVLSELDTVKAALVQHGLSAQSLSTYKGTTAPASTVTALPVYSATTAQGLGFFTYANLVLSLQPLEATDPALAAQLARIHVGSTQTFNAADFSEDIQAALLQGLADGVAAVQQASLSNTKTVNGWSSVDPSVLTDSGSFGLNYLARAAVAYTLLYMNTRVEAWYGITSVDGQDTALTGAKSYTIHFASGQLPPANFFWSVTAYDSSTHLFINNLISRYKISSTSTGLQYNTDGSLDILVQQSPPTDLTKFANWLPVSSTPFYLITRSYGPGQGILEGTWQPPPVLAQ